MQSNRKPTTEEREKTPKEQAKEDLAFIEELERQQLVLGLEVRGDLKLQKRLIFQWIYGNHPYIWECNVCTGTVSLIEENEEAAVNLRRLQAHCDVHKKWFHENSPLQRGCVTCQRYHPITHPLNRR